jgi:hypothetical protein
VVGLRSLLPLPNYRLLHMGYVDEVLFGYEVIERLPALVKELVAIEKARVEMFNKHTIPDSNRRA